MSKMLKALKIADARQQTAASPAGDAPRGNGVDAEPPAFASPVAATPETSPDFQASVRNWLRGIAGIDLFGLSPFGEQYRALMRQLMKPLPAGERKILAFTATAAGQGVTTTIVHLAALFAERADCSVLVVDGNFRAPAIQHRFRVSAALGLSDVLSGQCDWADAVVQTIAPNLNLLTAGTVRHWKSGDGVALAIRDLYARLRQSYSLVLVDAGLVARPVALELLRQADGSCLVLQSGAVRRKPAIATVRRLRRAGARLVGCSIIVPADDKPLKAA
jgi:Mrp family chromosome partitioning ATPase